MDTLIIDPRVMAFVYFSAGMFSGVLLVMIFDMEFTKKTKEIALDLRNFVFDGKSALITEGWDRFIQAAPGATNIELSAVEFQTFMSFFAKAGYDFQFGQGLKKALKEGKLAYKGLPLKRAK